MSLSKRIGLAALILLTAEVLGVALLPSFLKVIRGWLLIWPPPEEHFASLAGDLAWPTSVLVIVWLLRRPITRAAFILAERMKNDNLKLGGFFEVTKSDFNTMDARIVAEHVQAAPVMEDVNETEALLEYAGYSNDNAERLLKWIAERLGANMDPEEFLTSPSFANDRHTAYITFIGE